jgi:hypothetical protein
VTEVFPIRSKRAARMRRVQTAQHLLAAALLASTAFDHLTDPHHARLLPLLELATALVLILTAILERVRTTHARVGWFELAGAAMMYVEAFARLEERHHTSFYVVGFLPPTILLLFGLFDERIRHGMRLEANDEGLLLQTRVLRKKRVRWEGVTSYRITARAIELIRGDGTVAKLPTKDLENAAEAARWAEEQFARRGIPPASQGFPTA